MFSQELMSYQGKPSSPMLTRSLHPLLKSEFHGDTNQTGIQFLNAWCSCKEL